MTQSNWKRLVEHLFLDDKDREEAMEILADLEGVDEAPDRDPAAQRFWLIDSRIGDITIFGASDRVFDDATEGTSLAICVATGPYAGSDAGGTTLPGSADYSRLAEGSGSRWEPEPLVLEHGSRNRNSGLTTW